METVTSRDGTPIAYWRSGSGPPLLLVHGATAAHDPTWRIVGPLLAERHTVYAMDRRGRGGSGDTAPYHLQREAEDVAAVVDAVALATGGPVDVLGHSYGGLSALESVPLRGAGLYPPGIAERLEALLEAGDVEGALVTMYRDLVEMPPEEIEMLRAQRDAWETRLANVPSMPRELRAEQAYVFLPERFRAMRAPTLLLVGEDSPPREHDNARGVAAGLRDARVTILPGQQHAAMYMAPDLFVAEVLRFLAGQETP